MVKREEASHIAHQRLSGWAVLMPLTFPIGFPAVQSFSLRRVFFCPHQTSPHSLPSLAFTIDDLNNPCNNSFLHNLPPPPPPNQRPPPPAFLPESIALIAPPAPWTSSPCVLGIVPCPLCPISFSSRHLVFHLVMALIFYSLPTFSSSLFRISFGTVVFTSRFFWGPNRIPPLTLLYLFLTFINCFLHIEAMWNIG